jgi:hypothetical protein
VIRHVAGRTVIAAAILIAIVGYLFLNLRVVPSVFARSKNDFACFYRAGRMVVTGEGYRVYELSAEREYDDALGTKSVGADGKAVSLPFVFAPFTLVLFAPLAELSFQQAAFVWYTLNVAILLALPFLLRRRLDLSPNTLALTLIAPLLPSGHPRFDTRSAGHPDVAVVRPRLRRFGERLGIAGRVLVRLGKLQAAIHFAAAAGAHRVA